jgi:deoxyribose-phosphate aldolase
MNMEDYGKKDLTAESVSAEVKSITALSHSVYNAETLKKIFGLIDLTTLNTTDTEERVMAMCRKVNHLSTSFPGMPDVAAICVYPALVKTVKEHLKVPSVNIASVTGGFPSSQTFLSVKIAETSLAVEKGADEVDMVISVGKFFEQKYLEVADEITLIKNAAGKAHVKVILESGALRSMEEIRIASLIAMEAGADFIKTSTGKMEPAATLDAAWVMTDAICDFYKRTGRKVGFKPAGGISTSRQAADYYTIVKHNLGEEWLNPDLFRIGASRLANDLISEIIRLETGKQETIQYF